MVYNEIEFVLGFLAQLTTKTKLILDFQAQLAARRARRAAEIQKATERRRKQKAKEDEEKRLEELARIREEETAREAESDGLDVPDVLITDNLEVQVAAFDTLYHVTTAVCIKRCLCNN